MSEDRFDAIIVGAGVAGGAAAYVLAEAGLEVLLLERGDAPGSKNMTGGRLYGHSLERLMPGFAAQAPVQRRVVKESVTLLTGESGVTLDFESPCLRAVLAIPTPFFAPNSTNGWPARLNRPAANWLCRCAWTTCCAKTVRCAASLPGKTKWKRRW